MCLCLYLHFSLLRNLSSSFSVLSSTYSVLLKYGVVTRNIFNGFFLPVSSLQFHISPWPNRYLLLPQMAQSLSLDSRV